METTSFKKIIITTGVSLTVIFLSIILTLYIRGWRVHNWSIVKTGAVILSITEPDTKVYVDGNEIYSSKKAGEIFTISNLVPGNHEFLLASIGYWPWSKNLEVQPEESLNVVPFSAPKDITGVVILKNDPIYDSIIKKFADYSLPLGRERIISSDKKVSIRVNDGDAFAEWLGPIEQLPDSFCTDYSCKNIIQAVKVSTPITSIDFYKYDNNVLLFSAGTGIFAIEINKNGIQNFQPVYTGADPKFIKASPTELYILDNGILLRVNL